MNEVEKRTREFACPSCGAGNDGEACVTRSGNRLAIAHADRFNLAVRAGRLPLPVNWTPGNSE